MTNLMIIHTQLLEIILNPGHNESKSVANLAITYFIAASNVFLNVGMSMTGIEPAMEKFKLCCSSNKSAFYTKLPTSNENSEFNFWSAK